MEKHLKAYAGMIAQELAFFSSLETSLRGVSESHEMAVSDVKHIRSASEAMYHRAEELNLRLSLSKAAALSHVCLNTRNASEIRHRMRDLRETMIQELHQVKFLTASRDMVDYLQKETPFGKAVAQAFPECSEDISEAYNCFAFGRYTASMFHLGRAMEIAVKRVAKKIGVKAYRDEWQAYLTAMNEHINKMPFKTAKDKARRTPMGLRRRDTSLILKRRGETLRFTPRKLILVTKRYRFWVTLAHYGLRSSEDFKS